VPSRTYEVTFSGQAGRTLRAQFDDCEVTTTPETTTLRTELPDPAALSGLVERIVGLGLEIMDVHLLTRPSVPRPVRSFDVEFAQVGPGEFDEL